MQRLRSNSPCGRSPRLLPFLRLAIPAPRLPLPYLPLVLAAPSPRCHPGSRRAASARVGPARAKPGCREQPAPRRRHCRLARARRLCGEFEPMPSQVAAPSRAVRGPPHGVYKVWGQIGRVTSPCSGRTMLIRLAKRLRRQSSLQSVGMLPTVPLILFLPFPPSRATTSMAVAHVCYVSVSRLRVGGLRIAHADRESECIAALRGLPCACSIWQATQGWHARVRVDTCHRGCSARSAHV